MIAAETLGEQIRTNLRSLDADPRCCAVQDLWLTFYLTGNTSSSSRIADALAVAGWSNTDNWDGGFLYPKVLTARAEAPVLSIASEVQALAERHAVSMFGIDADTSAKVAQN